MEFLQVEILAGLLLGDELLLRLADLALELGLELTSRLELRVEPQDEVTSEQCLLDTALIRQVPRLSDRGDDQSRRAQRGDGGRRDRRRAIGLLINMKRSMREFLISMEMEQWIFC